ncbi:OPT superfamily oligopeptide transporter [Hortaea werneckii]|nr:OPT superfamily oligopeptide transporter [Hortaea werneckii]
MATAARYGSSGNVADEASHVQLGDHSIAELTDMSSKTAHAKSATVDEEYLASTPQEDRGYSSEESARKDVLYAAGVGLIEDNSSLPCLTLRMWVIGSAFCLLGSGVNTLYTFRIPSITLSQSAIQFLAYPVGKIWYMVVPEWSFSILGQRISLNPGPFNYKENILIYIMANLSFLTRLSADVLTEQRVFYDLELGWGFEIIMTAATLLFGLALAGICFSLVVAPPSLTWPGVLGNTALNAALHVKRDDDKSQLSSRWTMSRYRFFLIAFAASFCWYWLPDLIFPALGYFTWLCWIAPENAVINQVFGMKSGIGLLPITFDWSQIAYIGSPLVVPTWAILNVLASLIVWIYIISPALYYSNVWDSAYYPIQSNSIFDNLGKQFNTSRVVNQTEGFTLNEAAYHEYSDIYLPLTYALNTFGLCFASIASLFVWLVLEKREDLMKASRLPGSLVAVVLGIVASEAWPIQLHWYGALLSFAISAIFFIPLAWVYATTNVKIQVDIICRIIAGYIWEGKVLANIWFFNLGYISGVKGLAFAQDLKLGVYCNIPPRKLFAVQLVGIIFGTLGQVSVINWALNHIPASGTNYGSWAIVGLLFGILIKKDQKTWWRRFNFVLSAALDCSTAIAGIVIFFAIFYTGASKNLKWWGTDVYKVGQRSSSRIESSEQRDNNADRTHVTGIVAAF